VLPSENRFFQIVGPCCLSLLLAGAASATTGATSTKPKSKPPQSSTQHSSQAHSSSAHKSSTHGSSAHKSSAHHSTASSHHSKATKTAKSHGQHGISEDRTREIQNALIREHYLNGEPTGKMDQSTKDALTKYQADNGWQTKITPDSRALIKLGLGPDHKGLLNPDTASIPSPHELGNDSTQPGGAADQQ